jgi:AraC-like DNA-binding protein
MSANYKINEVADMVGYSVPSNFSRDFQKQFGMSPSSYVSGLNDQNKNHS